MKWPSALSLRTSLLLVVALALAPSRALDIYTTCEMRSGARAEALSDATRLARATSRAGDRLFEATRQILALVARLPEVREQDAAACSALFADLLKSYPQVANLAAARRDGGVFCSGVPTSGGGNVSDRNYFRRAVESRGFSWGEYRVGQVTGKAVINFAYPVLGRSGEVSSVVFTGLDLSWLNRALAEFRLPEGSTLTAVDDAGVVLARYPEGDAWVGRSFPEAPIVRAATADQRDGTVEATGLDGAQRLYAFVPLRAGERDPVAYLYVGIPSASAFAKVNRVANLAVFGFGVALVVALLVTALGSRLLILGPVHHLVGAMRRVGEGDLAARAGVRHGRSEMGQLAAAFDEMAERLERRAGRP
jgi:HAMP domain-containing protein